MTETPASKTAFAPVWPSLNSRSYSAESEIIPSYSRTRVFNHDLTTDQLKPLLEDCPVPGRKLRRIGGGVFLSAYALLVILFLASLAITRLHVPGDFPMYQYVDASFQALGLLTLAAAAVWLTGVVMDFIARKKWVAALLGAWKLHNGHIVRTRDLPAERQRYVNNMGRRLDGALESLDANDPTAEALNIEARAAIARYFELPAIGDDERRVAESTANDPAVQHIREEYKASVADENGALQRAEDAVRAVAGYAAAAKAAAADQEIIDLARSIAGAVS